MSTKTASETAILRIRNRSLPTKINLVIVKDIYISDHGISNHHLDPEKRITMNLDNCWYFHCYIDRYNSYNILQNPLLFYVLIVLGRFLKHS